MGIDFVEANDGLRRIRPLGVVALFAACYASCMAIPAAFFWLAFRDAHLVSTSLGLGFSMATFFFSFILLRALRLPAEALPQSDSGEASRRGRSTPAGIHFVEVDRGRRRIRPLGIVAFFAICVTCCVAFPATFFWLAFRDPHLVSTTLVLGWIMACSLSAGITVRALGLPLDELPRADAGKAKGRDPEILGPLDA